MNVTLRHSVNSTFVQRIPEWDLMFCPPIPTMQLPPSLPLKNKSAQQRGRGWKREKSSKSKGGRERERERERERKKERKIERKKERREERKKERKEGRESSQGEEEDWRIWWTCEKIKNINNNVP